MNPVLKGSFRLHPAVRLIPGSAGGVVLKKRPLRAFRVNEAALAILRRCREGLSPGPELCTDSSPSKQSMLGFFDRLCTTGILEWRPPQDNFEPLVSIVIPVYNRAPEIRECLDSLGSLDYPAAKLEIIVVDDASTDNTAEVAKEWGAKLIVQPYNQGQSAARNLGVLQASGEIVAFIDSDCVADPNWLRELVPFFQDPRVALVGGYVASYFLQSRLDRYEEAKSPLNMGEALQIGSGEQSDFYVPTCNMLVKKSAYQEIGGLNESFRVGEDVDLCWRLKRMGFRLMYVPQGRIEHKHRNGILESVKRRFEYGTSEPVLYSCHPEVCKRFPWQPAVMLGMVAIVLGLLTGEVSFLAGTAMIVVVDTLVKRHRYEEKLGIALPLSDVFRATVEKHYQLVFHLTNHAIRYHLLAILVAACLWKPLLPVAAAILLFPSVVEFLRTRPRLSFPTFCFFFWIEQASYQLGVWLGCMKQRSFRPFSLTFTRSHQGNPIGIRRGTGVLDPGRSVPGSLSRIITSGK